MRRLKSIADRVPLTPKPMPRTYFLSTLTPMALAVSGGRPFRLTLNQEDFHVVRPASDLVDPTSGNRVTAM